MSPYSFLDLPPGADQPTRFEFDSATASVRKAASGPVAVPLPNLGLIRVEGEEAIGFLHNLLSNDVRKLAPGALQWNSLNSPKGRMIASLLMWRDGEGILIALSADLHALVQKKLSMFILRSKVRISDASAQCALIAVAGDGAAAVLEAAALATPTAGMSATPADAPRTLQLAPELYIVLASALDSRSTWNRLLAAGAAAAGTAAWDWMLIRAGLPQVTQPTQEEFVAQMLNFELIGGVSFTKGCYPGQEVVARTQYLGKLKKRMYRLHLSGEVAPKVGDDLFGVEFGDQSIGKVVLQAPSPDGGFEVLAVLQSSCAEAGGVHLGRPDGAAVEILPLPYSLG